MERYYAYSRFLKEYFGDKIYKICLDAGFTCPNRDGTLSYEGCLFCSEGGSGEYAENSSLSIREQILLGKEQTAKKYQGQRYLAYFQAFTNTYAPLPRLRRLYEEAIRQEGICGIIIGTRPDCLPEPVLDYLEELQEREKKPVFMELGFQTCHDETARFLNRGYDSEIFRDAVIRCHDHNLRVTAHIIAGLPGETKDMQYETIDYLNRLPISGVKISMLNLLKNTPLASWYREHPFHIYTMEEYVDLVIGYLERLRPDIVIERITGDGSRKLLIAPGWILHKHRVLNTIRKEMKERNTRQGIRYV
ncbi:MAG: TIGR01212 family radical SAM protein [Eubacterium sp.]|nr:TIGR01212 family radical SAM protein [Eubacterium sp.]